MLRSLGFLKSPPLKNPRSANGTPPPSALDATLPAFAAESRRLQHGARSCRLISAADDCDQQQTRGAPQLLQPNDGTDRLTDGRTTDRYKNPAPHTMRTASTARGGGVTSLLPGRWMLL